jgi:hypothetical protein
MQTITRQPRIDRMALWLLHSPAHRLLGARVCQVEYLGRTTGALHRLPVEIVRDRGRLIVLAAHASQKQWWRNFQGVGHQLTISAGGAVHRGYGVALAPGDPGYADALFGYVQRRRAPADDDHRLVVIRLLN